MAWLDIAILVVVVMSTLISLLRGFVKESISLATWLAAGFIAVYYHQQLSQLLIPYFTDLSIPYITPEILSMGVAFVILFIATLIVGAIVNYMVSQLVNKTGLSGTDKLLGMIFGFARGVLIVTVIVFSIMSFTTMPESEWWKQSILVEYFIDVAGWLRDIMPEGLGASLPS